MIDKINRISDNMEISIRQMRAAINESQNFLSGQQFEKAKDITTKTVENSRRCCSDLTHTTEYLERLRTALMEYRSCIYSGGR